MLIYYILAMTDNIPINTQSNNIQSNNIQPTNTQSDNVQSNNVQQNNVQSNNIQSNNVQSNTIQSNSIDKCDPIRQSLISNNVDVNKYNLCYTKSLSIHTDAQCTLCRHDTDNKSFICRPNMADEEVISFKDFCTPLKKMDKTHISNVYYQNIIDICQGHKNKKKSKI